MASESSFWAIELTKGNPESTWPGESVLDDEAEEAAEHILEVERACLGASAKANDLNVVSVHTFVNDGESTVATPIARLKVNGKEQCRIGLQFHSQVTFKLTSGNGPVHLMGLKETVFDDDMDSDEEMIDDMDSEEEAEEALQAMPAIAGKKRPASGSQPAPPAKKNQRTVSMPADDDDSEEDDSEEDSDDELNLMAPNGEDEDSEDDEDMDDDDEDDDEDDEEDSEEDEPPKLVKAGKPQQQKGKGPQQQQKGGKPQQQGKQQQKPQGGKPQQQAGKPQQQQQKQTPQKGKGGAAAPPSIEAVLAKLKSSPNLPKKQEKFVNLVKNNFSVKDEKVINELWAKVQKSRN